MSIDRDRVKNSSERHLHTGLDLVLALMELNASLIESDGIEQNIQNYANILRSHYRLIKLNSKEEN